LVRAALHLTWQRSWCAYLRDHDHAHSLGRLRQVVSRWPVVFLGTRGQQSLLARLRLGHCCLRAHRSRFNPAFSPLCECGEPETVQHFLLHCRKFVSQRSVMFAAVRSVYDLCITESVLLGDCERVLTPTSHLRIISAVYRFTVATRRFSSYLRL
jgi:hypothetical protein